MKDLIDLGNLIFNQLVSNHGEIEESRMLFLYQLTTSTTWHILNSNHWIQFDRNGVIKNFNDPEIDKLDAEWKALKLAVDIDFLNRKLEIMRSEFDRKAPKDGEIWEFGASNGPFRSLNFDENKGKSFKFIGLKNSQNPNEIS